MERRVQIEWPDSAPTLTTAPAPEEGRAFERLLRRRFYVIADTHFFHANIVRYARRPTDHDSLTSSAGAPPSTTATSCSTWATSSEYLGWEISFSHWPFRPGETQAGERRLRVHGHTHNRGYRSPGNPSELWSPLGSVNVSVEVVDYAPVLISDLLAARVNQRRVP